LAATGTPYAWLRLDAPRDASSSASQRAQQADAWHALERGGNVSFRWTRSNRIAWHDVLPQVHRLRLRISVPFVNEITPGFAEGCTVEIGGQVLRPSPHGRGELVFETTLDAPAEDGVILHTPEPASPHDLRGFADDRRLGLAMPVYPWEPPSTS
jgi:hypothetical protein